MGIRDCLDDVVKAGRLSREDADRLAERYDRAKAAEERGEQPAGFARDHFLGEIEHEALEAKRRKLLQIKTANEARRDINRFAIEQGPDVGAAIFRMFENFGFTGYSSVRGIQSALIGAAHAEMEAAVHAFRRSGITLQRRGNALLDEVVRAAFGNSNDPAAQALYKAWLAPAEKLRGLFNEAGGNIGWLERWGLPMSHDAGAVGAAGFDKWRGFVESRLNWEEMKHGGSQAPILLSEREDVLRHVWESIVTDGWNTRDPAAPGFRAKWAQRQDHRFLIFKDGDAWSDYNRAYGKGDAWATMTGHIRSMARDVALMQRLGPNPGATVDWLKNIVMQEAMKAEAGKPNLFKRDFEIMGKSLKDNRGSARAQMETIDGLYSIARGDGGAAGGFLADTGAVLRNLQYSAKLGGAIITHAGLNPIVQSYARHVHGLPVAGQLGDMVRAIGGEREATRAGLIVGDALHVLEQGAREAATGSRLRALSNWLPKAVVQWSGLEPFVNAQRRAFMFGAMSHFADLADRGWADLPEKTRRLLAGYGLRSDEWEHLRQAQLYEPAKGAPFLRFSDIAAAAQEKREALLALGKVADVDLDAHMRGLSYKYLEMLHGETERAVPSTSWRARAMLVGNSREDTLWGQARRSFGMFKGFMGSFMLTHLQALKQEMARDKASGAAAAGAYLTALTLGGMAVLQLKGLASGKDLRSVDPSTKEGRDTWMHAALISGGLGIFGDFLASDRSAYGHGPLETAAGPSVTGAVDLYSALRRAGEGRKSVGQKLAGGAVDLLRNNTPILSTHWALRAAYNRLLLDNLQRLADPEAHDAWRRAEERLRKETGQGYYWPRGAPAPERLPGMAR